MNSKLPELHRKGVAALLIILTVLVVSAGAFVVLANSKLPERSLNDVERPSALTADITLSLSTLTVNINQDFTVDAVIDTHTNKVSAVDLNITFPSDKLQLLSITKPTSGFLQVLLKQAETGNGSGSIVLGSEPDDLRSGKGTLVVLKFRALGATTQDQPAVINLQSPSLSTKIASVTSETSIAGNLGSARVTVLPVNTLAQNGTIVAAGDIATENLTGDSETSDLILSIKQKDPDLTVLTLGDNAYETGLLSEYTNYYHPTWGKFRSITKPSPGNHEYTSGGSGYYDYYCPDPGKPTDYPSKATGCVFPEGVKKEYYSFDYGNWHFVSLNSEIDTRAGSPQVQWLRQDLSKNTKECTLAYWHEPRFSSGSGHGNDISVGPFWDVLYQYKADVVLGGHDHNYERFAQLNPSGQPDSKGIREFVVGTGGQDRRGTGSVKNGSEFQDSNNWGILKLTLWDTSYDWQFISTTKETIDGGSANCVLNSSAAPLQTKAAASPPRATPPQPTGLNKKADFDGDGDVDWTDYGAIREHFGETGCPNIADTDNNCVVDIFDYNVLASTFNPSNRIR